MMIGYVYFSESKIINNKIHNVEYIDSDCKEIRGINEAGDSVISVFNGGSDFIILETDTVSKNIGEEISLDGLIDARDFFLKGKDFWYQEQIKQSKELIDNQSTTINKLNEDMNTTLLGIADVYEQILSGGGTTTP